MCECVYNDNIWMYESTKSCTSIITVKDAFAFGTAQSCEATFIWKSHIHTTFILWLCSHRLFPHNKMCSFFFFALFFVFSINGELTHGCTCTRVADWVNGCNIACMYCVCILFRWMFYSDCWERTSKRVCDVEKKRKKKNNT